MEYLKNTKYYKEKDLLILIVNHNLVEQNEYLVTHGFHNFKRNLKYLLKFEKDLEKVF